MEMGLEQLPTAVNLGQLGMAGLLGGLWLYERKYSRGREEQLDEAHAALMSQKEHLGALIEALQNNTRALEGLRASQAQVLEQVRGKACGG